jgi:NTP pyrophosphatase (non-canonical NTP hydrolase)
MNYVTNISKNSSEKQNESTWIHKNLQGKTKFLFEKLENIFEIEEGQKGACLMKEKIHKISEHYGYYTQSRQLIEEMAELTKALNKFWRKNLLCGQMKLTPELVERLKDTPEYKDVLEEIADVEIMLNQIVYLLDMDTSEMVDFKLQRQIERIDSECLN